MLQAHRISEPDVTEQLNSQLFGLAFTHCQRLFTGIVRSVMVYIVTGVVAFSSAIFLLICPYLKIIPHILSFLIFFFGVFLVFHFITWLFGYMCVCVLFDCFIFSCSFEDHNIHN